MPVFLLPPKILPNHPPPPLDDESLLDLDSSIFEGDDGGMDGLLLKAKFAASAEEASVMGTSSSVGAPSVCAFVGGEI